MRSAIRLMVGQALVSRVSAAAELVALNWWVFHATGSSAMVGGCDVGAACSARGGGPVVGGTCRSSGADTVAGGGVVGGGRDDGSHGVRDVCAG